jgi:hypothetical protein
MGKTGNATRILVQTHPGASKNEVMRLEDGVWHIRVAAPPVEGKANRALIEFLSEALGVSKSRITIEKGVTSRTKRVGMEGMTVDMVTEKLQQAMS